MSDCERFGAMISALLDGELSEAEEAEVRAHMAECAECRAMYEAFAAVGEAFKTHDVPDTLHDGIMAKVHEAEKARKTHGTIVRFRSFFAAAACLVVLVGTVFALKNNLARPRYSSTGSTAKAAAMAPESMKITAGGAADEGVANSMMAVGEAAPESVEILQSMAASDAAAPEAPAEAPEAPKNESADAFQATEVEGYGTLYGADEVYPTVMVNNALYEWRKGGAICLAGLPEQAEYYGEVTHTDAETPKRNGEFAALFQAEGTIYTVPGDEDVVYLQLTTDWMEDTVVCFDRVK